MNDVAADGSPTPRVRKNDPIPRKALDDQALDGISANLDLQPVALGQLDAVQRYDRLIGRPPGLGRAVDHDWTGDNRKLKFRRNRLHASARDIEVDGIQARAEVGLLDGPNRDPGSVKRV